MHGTEYDMELG